MSSAFTFKAPLPPDQSSTTGSQGVSKQRRVSLALPSSPRVFPAWSFRDDTGLGVHSADAGDELQRGKMRRIAADEGAHAGESSTAGPGTVPPADKPEKKPRKKWTMEETKMLVAGCNKVRTRVPSLTNIYFLPWSRELTRRTRRMHSGASGTGNLSSTTLSSSSMDGRRSI